MLLRVLKHLKRWASAEHRQHGDSFEWYQLRCAIIELEGLLPRGESEPADASGYTGDSFADESLHGS
jgi:hypothetical protein